MPTIRSSSDLRNKYSEISDYCHQHSEPVFLTKNGKGDLAVMSIESYEKLVGQANLKSALLKGLKDVENKQTRPATEVFSRLNNEIL